MNDDGPAAAPNLRTACVVMFGVNLSWILVAIWAIWGFLIAVMFSVGLNHLITRTQVWAEARAARHRRDPKPRAWWQLH